MNPLLLLSVSKLNPRMFWFLSQMYPVHHVIVSLETICFVIITMIIVLLLLSLLSFVSFSIYLCFVLCVFAAFFSLLALS